ncbi:MAG: pyruvate, phosphate dikinase [Spirochaetales bacterium]|nr:pyruvate, phosphate dikinase [Candidatus Physcosoma equi]
MHYQLDETWIPFSSLMLKHVYNVLLICSDYDRFMLEEDGRVEEELYKEYTSLGLSNPPKISHANNGEDAMAMLKTQKFDLVISMLDLGTGKVEGLAERVKSYDPTLPFIVLSPSPDHRKAKELKGENCTNIDYLFYWLGNPTVFLAMVKLIEDYINIDHDTDEADVEVLIFVEDSVRFISSYLPEMYKLLIQQNRASILEALNEWGMKLRMRGRPKIVLARDYEEAWSLYKKYKENVLGVISDLSFPSPWGKDEAGLALTRAVKADNAEIPVLIQSTEKEAEQRAREAGADFLWKLSPDKYQELEEYFKAKYDFGPFHFIDPLTGETIAVASTMKELQNTIKYIPISSFIYHVRRNDFSRWLRAQSLYQLASMLKPIQMNPDGSNAEETRTHIYQTIREYRKERTRGTIAEFSRDSYDETLLFTRMGKGSLGGKGRGLAFIAMEMKAAKIRRKYPEVYVSIPRTIVISTELFDLFMETNDFYPSDFTEHNDDNAILQMFLDAKMPEELELNLKKILEVVTSPMSVRSSSLLEDSHFQPFAGVYQTSMISNSGTQEERLEDLKNAVKTVWASTYFAGAREYLKRTGHAVEEEKMAVILQQITGSDHNGYWFPNISGVARSLDYYPAGSRTAEDGIGMLAFGMGKTIVDEGSAFRFCPAKPKIPVSSMNGKGSAQRKYYALDRSIRFNPLADIDNLVQKPISDAYQWPKAVRGIVSVMTPDGYMSESPTDNGFKSLTFNGIIKYDMIPLAKIVDDVLKLGTKTMSEPVEIEFAVNTEHAGVPDFSILQIRPISSTDQFENIDISEEDQKDSLISSNKVMGNGKVEGIRDIICVKPDAFVRSEMPQMAVELEELNASTEDLYVLVAAGRLGSSDQWLGIPCSWSQISKAHVIVETGLKEIQAEPSEGTHFFQNMTSLGCLYLTINPISGDGSFQYDEISKLKKVQETKHFLHVRTEKDLIIKADGLSGKAIIKKDE